MSRTSLSIGLALSVAGHVLALWPHAGRPLARDTSQPVGGAGHATVGVAPAPPPAPERGAETRQLRHPPPLERLIRPTAANDDQPGRRADDISTDATPPTLRIAWRSPDHMLEVARALGLRVVAIDAAQAIVGEVDLRAAPLLRPFDGTLAQFSNRIRTLPRDYFGPLTGIPATTVTTLWILVPAAVDRTLIEAQRRAIRDAGRDAADVNITEGQFERHDGGYRLIITNLM